MKWKGGRQWYLLFDYNGTITKEEGGSEEYKGVCTEQKGPEQRWAGNDSAAVAKTI